MKAGFWQKGSSQLLNFRFDIFSYKIMVYLACISQSRHPFNLTFFLLQVFLVVELPLGIIVIFHTVASSLDLEFLNYYAIKCTLMILNMIISLSYPLNFGIYCGMSQQFRETFMKLFGARIPNMPKWCCRCKRENDSHTSVDAVSIWYNKHFFLIFTVLIKTNGIKFTF